MFPRASNEPRYLPGPRGVAVTRPHHADISASGKDPATSNAIRESKDGAGQGSDAVPSCLQKATAENYKAVDAVIKFLCSYLAHKDMINKEELIKATEDLMNVTGCSAEDLFGSDASLEQVALDENGVLTKQTLAMKQLLTSHVLVPINEAVCAFVDSLEKSNFTIQGSKGDVHGHKRTTRDVLSLLGGLVGVLDGLGGLLSLLALVGKLAKVLEPVIAVAGLLLDGLSGVTGLLGGGQSQGDLLGGILGGLTGGLGGLTGGLLGGGQSQGDLLGGLLGSVTGTVGGLTGGLGGGAGGLLGGGQSQADLLGGLLGSVTGTVGGLTGGLGGLTGGLTGGGNGGSNILGGLLGR